MELIIIVLRRSTALFATTAIVLLIGSGLVRNGSETNGSSAVAQEAQVATAGALTSCTVPRLVRRTAVGPGPPKLTEAEIVAAYDCVSTYMAVAYARSNHETAAAYRSWTRFSRTAYPAEAHGARFLNNYANEVGRDAYGKFEGVGTMPTGSVLAKDSFIVTPGGAILVGPLYVMEKRTAGFSEAARDWFYQTIKPDGAVRADGEIQKFCNDCHRRAGAVDDHLMFLPLRYRKASTSD